MSTTAGMLTFDVEDWHHANFAQLRGKEDEIRSRVVALRYPVERNIDLWLEILARHDAKSTCFILGEFAQNHREAVRKIAEAGHEIACHGLTHDLIYEMSQERFREYLKSALGVLGEVSGRAPIGFRAPSWSVDAKRTPWFCEELERAGLRYDSSEFPMKTPLYGSGDSPTQPYRQGNLIRIPVTMLEIAGGRIPFSSGAFFRLAPLPLIRFGLKRAVRRSNTPMIVLHPRELDPAHPRLPLEGWESWVHYGRLGTAVPKLEAVLKMMKWSSIEKQLDHLV